MTYERRNIAAMAGYSYGEQPQHADVIKLNTNENPYPPSPAVQQALSSLSAATLRTYPSATAARLRSAIAAHHGVTPEHVLVTHGGDEGLRLAMTTFVGPGDTFAMAEPSYSLYPVLAAVQDARVLELALDDDWRLATDVAETLRAEQTRLCALVNPHAPSGTLTPAADFAALASGIDGVLLIDEAYADFVSPDAAYDATPLLREHDNVLILRTFSKGYGLAGLRLAYLLGSPALIEPMLTKTRDSYNIDAISQQLGLAALEDQPYASSIWARVRADRDALAAGLTQLGFRMPPSQANFLLCAVPGGRPDRARALHAALRERQIFVRYFDTPRLATSLRISVGTGEQNQRLIAALQELLETVP